MRILKSVLFVAGFLCAHPLSAIITSEQLADFRVRLSALQAGIAQQAVPQELAAAARPALPMGAEVRALDNVMELKWQNLQTLAGDIVVCCTSIAPSLEIFNNRSATLLKQDFARTLTGAGCNLDVAYWKSFLGADITNGNKWGQKYLNNEGDTLQQHRLFVQLLDLQNCLLVDVQNTVGTLNTYVREMVEGTSDDVADVENRLMICMVMVQMPSIIDALAGQGSIQAPVAGLSAPDAMSPTEHQDLQTAVERSLRNNHVCEEADVAAAIQRSLLSNAEDREFRRQLTELSADHEEQAALDMTRGKQRSLQSAFEDERFQAEMARALALSAQMAEPEPVAPSPVHTALAQPAEQNSNPNSVADGNAVLWFDPAANH